MGTTPAQLVPNPLPFPLAAFQSRDTGHKGGRQELGRVLAVPAGRDPIAREGVGPAHHCGSGAVSLVSECVAAGSRVPTALWGSCPLAGSGERLKHPPVPQGSPQLPSPACVPRGKRVPACYPEPCFDLMSPLGSAWGRGGCWGIGRAVVLHAGCTGITAFPITGHCFKGGHRASGQWGRTLGSGGTSPSCAGTSSPVLNQLGNCCGRRRGCHTEPQHSQEGFGAVLAPSGEAQGEGILVQAVVAGLTVQVFPQY